jgi:hypothetical protein
MLYLVFDLASEESKLYICLHEVTKMHKNLR